MRKQGERRNQYASVSALVSRILATWHNGAGLGSIKFEFFYGYSVDIVRCRSWVVRGPRLWCRESPEGRLIEPRLLHPATGKLSVSPAVNG